MSDVYSTVRDCRSCGRNRHTTKRELRLFLIAKTARLQVVPINILRLLSRTNTGDRFIVVIRNRLSKLTQISSTTEMIATIVATFFINGWIARLRVVPMVLPDNRPQLKSQLFQVIYQELGVKSITTTADDSQSSGKADQFNTKIALKPCHYVTEHKQNWDSYVVLLTYSYNTELHRTARTAPIQSLSQSKTAWPPHYNSKFNTTKCKTRRLCNGATNPSPSLRG